MIRSVLGVGFCRFRFDPALNSIRVSESWRIANVLQERVLINNEKYREIWTFLPVFWPKMFDVPARLGSQLRGEAL